MVQTMPALHRTISLDPELFAQVKVRITNEGRTLSSHIALLLRADLAAHAESRKKSPRGSTAPKKGGKG